MINNIDDKETNQLSIIPEFKEAITKAINDAMEKVAAPYIAKQLIDPICIEQFRLLGKTDKELRDLCIEHFLCFAGFIYTNLNQQDVYDNDLLRRQLLLHPATDAIKCHFRFSYQDSQLVVEPINYPCINFSPIAFSISDDLNEIGRKINNLKIESFVGYGSGHGVMGNYTEDNDKEAIIPLKRVNVDGASVLRADLEESNNDSDSNHCSADNDIDSSDLPSITNNIQLLEDELTLIKST